MQTQVSQSSEDHRHGNADDLEYDSYLARMKERFARNLTGGVPVFETDAAPLLWDAYLTAFPEHRRQYHTCHACRSFIGRVGSLVTIGEDGTTQPAFWDLSDVPPDHVESVAAMMRLVKRAKVTGVFLTKEEVLGSPITGEWTHFHLTTPPHIRFVSPLLTPGQKMAEKTEDHKNVLRALDEFPRATVQQSLSVLRSDALYRSEKVLWAAEWLDNLHAACERSHRSNHVWRAIATAPAGFCHPRSSMIGTLLEDLLAGKPFEEVARAFKSKMHPLQYQRPQSAPSEGNLAQAEEIVRKLGIERSLERRYARLDEIVKLWTPTAEQQAPSGGVFGHLKPKSGPDPVHVTAGKITWVKFRDSVLPHAKRIECLVPHRGNFCALVTATHEDAPPILQWDLPGQRNPVNWYVYQSGSTCSQWGISAGWLAIAGLALKPHMSAGNEHHGKAAIALLPGMKDSRNTSLALFPEVLKSELHGIRKTIEAYSQSRTLGDVESPACGLVLPGGILRATASSGVVTAYEIDRWD